MQPVESFCHGTGLVALQRPDEMPFDLRIRLEGMQRAYLGFGFLQVVFTKSPLPAGGRFEQALSRPGLAHRQQGHTFQGASGALAGSGNALFHGLQVGGNCCHIAKPENRRRVYTSLSNIRT